VDNKLPVTAIIMIHLKMNTGAIVIKEMIIIMMILEWWRT